MDSEGTKLEKSLKHDWNFAATFMDKPNVSQIKLYWLQETNIEVFGHK